MISEFLDLFVRALVRAEVSASLSILFVLLIRARARRVMGAEVAYRLWGLPLAAAVSSLFPTLAEFRRGVSSQTIVPTHATLDAGVAVTWLSGVLGFIGLLTVVHMRFRREVRAGAAGPAVTGFGWQVLITPKDFRDRFDERERALILEHERMHIARRDPAANLMLGLLQALSWFNPLVHMAAAAARLDQEIACDEAVVRDRAGVRRLYAETLVKAQLSAPRSPFACAFVTGSRHPLETRLAMLARPRPGLARHLSSLALVGAMAALIAAAVWVGAPESRPGSSLGWEDPGGVVTITALSPSG